MNEKVADRSAAGKYGIEWIKVMKNEQTFCKHKMWAITNKTNVGKSSKSTDDDASLLLMVI